MAGVRLNSEFSGPSAMASSSAENAESHAL
jgi:hypothetical protein